MMNHEGITHKFKVHSERPYLFMSAEEEQLDVYFL